jgi:hypothetical protein
VTDRKSTNRNHDHWAIENHESGLIVGSLRAETTGEFHYTVYAPDLDRYGRNGDSYGSCQSSKQKLMERRASCFGQLIEYL